MTLSRAEFEPTSASAADARSARSGRYRATDARGAYSAENFCNLSAIARPSAGSHWLQ